MQLPQYPYKIHDSLLDYEFTSIGPEGRHIKKIVRFTPIGSNIFNLVLADLNEGTGELSDINVTNNRDTSKVLATVAMIVYDFILHRPKSWIVARGNTASRTRLYRMGITNNWKEIDAEFEVFGRTEGIWHAFEAGKEYDTFLIQRR